MTFRQKFIDLQSQLGELNARRDELLMADDFAGAENLLNDINELNPKLAAIKAAADLEEANAMQNAPVMNNEIRDMIEDRAERLRRGDAVIITAEEVRLSLFRNSTTLASGTIAEPTKVGDINEWGLGVSSIIDEVRVEDYTGCGAVLQPIVTEEQGAQSGSVSSTAGTARTATDPTLTTARLNPYEVSVTTYVDRNLSRLTPVAYEAKIRSMALRALRRKITALIYNGDGQGTPDFFGIKTAADTSATALYKTVSTGAIAAGILDKLVFEYGGSEEIGPNARLYLTKADLKAIGALRSNDGKRIYEIIPDAGNANTGRIVDGGLVVPYTIASALTSLSAQAAGSTQTPNTTKTMLYGDPKNFLLGLFGDYSIRVDESYKAAERMNTILGDVMVGGNLIAKDGFIVAQRGNS